MAERYKGKVAGIPTSGIYGHSYHKCSARARRLIHGEILRSISSDGDVMLAFLHGSFAQGVLFHDIDLALLINNDTRERIYHYTVHLTAELDARLGLPVDIQVLNSAPLPFRYNVFTNGQLILCRDYRLYHELFDITTRLYLDFKIFTALCLGVH